MNRVTHGDGEEYNKYYELHITENAQKKKDYELWAQQKGSEGKAETKGSSTYYLDYKQVEIQTDQIAISKLKTPNPNSTLETIFAKIKAVFLRKPDLSKKLTEKQTRELEEAKGKVNQFKKDIEHFHPLKHDNDKLKRTYAKENYKTARDNLRMAEAKLSSVETKIYNEQKELEAAKNDVQQCKDNFEKADKFKNDCFFSGKYDQLAKAEEQCLDARLSFESAKTRLKQLEDKTK